MEGFLRCFYPVGMLAAVVGATSPSMTRHIIPLPTNEALNPQYPDFFHNDTLIFAATPIAGGRSEIYQAEEQGSAFACLSCGLSPELAANLSKPFAFQDGSSRVLLRVGSQSPSQGSGSAILEVNATHPENSAVVFFTVPKVPHFEVLQQQREIRIAPDGQHVGNTQVVLDSNNIARYVAVVGNLHRFMSETGQPDYSVDEARIIASDVEMKRFSADGKRAIVASFNGVYDQGNADGQSIDLATGNVTRLTANSDYDEDISESPNGQWLVVGSSRTLQYTTAMSQIRRPSYVPGFIVGPMFTMKKGTTNQPWVVSRADELEGKNGLPLWVAGDGWTSLPVGNWNHDGSAVTFWESTGGLDNPNNTRIVVAHLSGAGSVGIGPGDITTPQLPWAPNLADYVPPGVDDILPRPGTHFGQVSGNASIEETTMPEGDTIQRTVTYNKFQHIPGQFIDGTESAVYTSSLSNITYSGSLSVSSANGESIGWLLAQNFSIINQAAMTGTIRSRLGSENIFMSARNGQLTVDSAPIHPAEPY